ncbi:MAG: aminotransferase class I/II-fold pyridoxal phosphate-dependent enzyme [Planctomycetes bacterium]|nr:aminotransferase class I/II-fold pyridoxal phosphate-dependent enzyme [Planctomycetota bacterium]
MRLSHRSQQLTPSATLAVANKAAEMRRAGKDIIGFGAGEPDFPTPAHIRDACKRALDAGHTTYAKPTHGIPEARAAVCHKFKVDNGLEYKSDQAIITVGGKEALYLACLSLIDPGDEVLLPYLTGSVFPNRSSFAAAGLCRFCRANRTACGFRRIRLRRPSPIRRGCSFSIVRQTPGGSHIHRRKCEPSRNRCLGATLLSSATRCTISFALAIGASISASPPSAMSGTRRRSRSTRRARRIR